MREGYSSVFTFCPHCGGRLVKGSERPVRPKCPSCGYVQYRNPTVGVAVVLLSKKKILLGKRAPHVSYGGMWCIPCGHLEWGEEVHIAAIRELYEESGLLVRITGVVAVHSNFHDIERQTVGIWFWGDTVGGELKAGDDLVEVGFFGGEEIPPNMAFPTDMLVIEELKRGGNI
jgi:8-oxo-dGTP diphosphatase